MSKIAKSVCFVMICVLTIHVNRMTRDRFSSKSSYLHGFAVESEKYHAASSLLRGLVTLQIRNGIFSVRIFSDLWLRSG